MDEYNPFNPIMLNFFNIKNVFHVNIEVVYVV